MRCRSDPESLANLREALQGAYEIEDELLQFEIHLRMGQIYNALHQYGIASMHYHLLFDILYRNKRENCYIPAGAYYDMSYSLYHAHDYKACIENGLKAMKAIPNPGYEPEDTMSNYQSMQQWNTIGLAYQKLQQPDSAFHAFDNAEKLAVRMKDKTWIGIIKGNKGDVYYGLAQYDSAYALLQYDYEQSLASKVQDNAANSLQWLARIDLLRGHKEMALEKAHQALALLKGTQQPNYLANVYYALSRTFTALGRPDSSDLYLDKYLHLHDSLQTEITKSNADIVQMRLNNLNQVQTIKILNREKSQIAIMRNFTILVIVLLGLIGYMWINRLRLKMQIRQRDALEGKRMAEAETQKAIEQLEVFRQHLLDKNAILEQWQAAQENKEVSDDQAKRLSELTHHLILNDDDWLKFKALFDSVYPGFFLMLRHKVPDISQAEQRMAALSKLKLTAKEAANLLGISPNSVYTARRRLRQRLGLEQDSDLDPYLASHSTS
jgi:DNA-binding CsgD family transcriptional regulator